MADNKEKLKILLEHLIGHNVDHAKEIKGLAESAGEFGFEDARELLLKGSEEMEVSNNTLKEALEIIKKGM
ncbi:hypothetical protein [Alkalibacter mobilis]|uniref:hypothetical protein n=1 Tax=Alkalibacter mobilis TaxID=2787712 RepID=UPI00189CEF58|nr:hypothetical protein [Alkalibacter mobilis]MBF7096479.1 hypothetical protein [Alkalibacter mobilis]